jgi:hypothetical protein
LCVNFCETAWELKRSALKHHAFVAAAATAASDRLPQLLREVAEVQGRAGLGDFHELCSRQVPVAVGLVGCVISRLHPQTIAAGLTFIAPGDKFGKTIVVRTTWCACATWGLKSSSL